MVENTKSRWFSLAILSIAFLGLSFLVLADTNPLFVIPTPAADSQVTDNVTINFTFNGTGNYTVFVNDSSTTTQICAENSTMSPQNCTWETLSFDEGFYTINLTVTNSSNASDVNTTLRTVEVEHPVNPQFISPTPVNGSNVSGMITFNLTWTNQTANWKINYTNQTSSGDIDNDLNDLPPQTVIWDTSSVPDGQYTFYGWVFDSSDPGSDFGFVTASNITIDNTVPSLTLLNPADNSNFAVENVTFNWTMSDNIDSSLTCDFFLDGGINTTLENETELNLTFTDKSYNWSVRCTDDSGNQNQSETRDFVVDTNPPVITEINITPATNNNLTNASPFISLLVNEGNLDSCEYSIGGSWNSLAITDLGSTAICNGTVPAQTDGTQLNFSFNATDTANNQVINFSRNLTVDATLPSITIESPQTNLNTSDGESFFVNATVSEANIVDGTVCTVTINEYTNSLTGSVLYNATSDACEGTLTIDDPSELPRDNLNFNLTVSVNDSVNNTGTDVITILVDNYGPSLNSISTNVTGNTVTNETDSILFTLEVFDANKITNVTLSNASTVAATNTSELGFGTVETFQLIATPADFGCPSVGPCTLQVSLNDSWGNVNDTNTFNIIIDNDFPSYSNLTINTTSAGLKEPILISALWDDQSLQSSSATVADLEKFNGSEFVVEDSLSLSNDLQWSNFTYIPTPSEDEGENLTFRIRYTDLAGRENATENLSVSITNVTPVIVNLTTLNLSSGVSDENPTIKIQYADEGSIDTVWLNLSGPTINNQTINSNQCTLLSNHEETVDEEGFANFTTSSYDATNYSFFVDSIEDAGSSSAKVTLIRYLYGRESPVVLDSWGDTYVYEDINVTLVNTTVNTTNKTTLSFADVGYQEYACNISYSDLPEGEYNVTLNITDSAGNRNASVFSWTVDGFRPNIINLSVGDQFVIQNSNSPSDVSVSSGSSFSVNWTLNESNMNSSRIQFIDREEQLRNGTTNSSSFSLRPGHHLGKFEAWDVIGEASATTVYFDLFLNSLTNISNISSELQNMSGITFQNFSIFRDGVDVTNEDSGRLNSSVRFEMEFNISSTNVSVNVSEFDGTRYNWEEQFVFASNLVSSSLTGVNPQFGVNTSGWYDEDAALENGSYYRNRFIPSNISRPSVNWSVNVTGNPFVVLIENLAQDKYHLLEECSSTSVNSFDDACYINNTNSYTILAPDLTGFVLGNDSGAPIISTEYPQGTNNSIFSIEFSVIEPSPVSDFCEYTIHENGSLISSGSPSLSDFELVGSQYIFTANFSEYENNEYDLTVTCEDSLGNNATLEESFTIADSIGPTFIEVNKTNIFTGEATLQVAVNEPSIFTVSFSSDFDNLDQEVSTESLSTTADILLDNLVQDETYFYRIEACDLNGECSFFPNLSSDPNFFRTLEASASGSGGGGGGGGGAALEGTIKASHQHGWNVVPLGPLVHNIDKEDIPVTKISLIIEEEKNNGFIRIDAYNGKPSTIPSLEKSVYEYFRLSYGGLVGDDHAIEFKVANDYLDEFEGETVFLYRLEDNSWQEYDTRELGRGSDFTTYSTDLPGFSYFAIGLELPEVTQNTEDAQNDNTSQTNQGTDEGEQQNGQNQRSQEEGEIVSYQEESGFAWWILVIILIAVVLSGGAYYVLTKKPEETNILLDEEDPFYKLQVYINKALDYGHSSEEIREKLLEAGWDDLIVDEEMEKIMSDRI